MHVSIFFICLANFVSRVLRLKRHDWQVYEEIKLVAEQSVLKKKQFDDSFGDLEFTAINIQRYMGDSDKVVKLCSEALGIHESNNIVTVIDVYERYDICRNDSSLIPDITACLLDYTQNCSKEEFQTDRVRLKFKTMRGKDLYGYEMVSRNVTKNYDIKNFTKRHLIHFVYPRVEFSIIKYINEFVYKIITKTLLQKTQFASLCSSRPNRINYSKLKCEVIKEITKKNFIKYASKSVVKFISIIPESDTFKNLINALGTEISNFHNNEYEKKFDNINVKNCEYTKFLTEKDVVKKIESIKKQIEGIYHKEIKNVIPIGIKNGLVKIIQDIQAMNDLQFIDSSKEYVSWLTQKIKIKEIVTHHHNTKELIEKYRLSRSDHALRIVRFIDSIKIYGLSEYDNLEIASDIDRYYDSECLKIVLNEKLTKENLQILCRILDNTINSENVRKCSIVFIDMRQGIEFLWDLDDTKKLTLKIKGDVFYYLPTELNIRNSVILTKKGGENIYISSAVGDISDYVPPIPSTDGNNKRLQITYKIRNSERHFDITKSVKITMDDSNSDPDRTYYSKISNCDYKAIKLVIRSINYSLHLTIKVYDGERGFELMRTYKCNDVNYVFSHSYDLEDLYQDQEKKAVFDISYLPNLIQYLRITTLSSFTTDIHFKAQFQNIKKYCEKIKFSVTANLTTELDVLVPTKLEKIQTTIVDYYKEKGVTKIARLKILLFDFLQRESNAQKWKDLTKQFLRESCMDEKMLCDAIDGSKFVQDKIYGTNEDGICGLNAHNYEIYICAIVRSEQKTKVYLTKRDFYFDFKHITMSEIMDLYVRLLNDETYLEKAHPLNYLHMTSHTIAHPLSYIFKTLSNFGSNLLEMIEDNSCYEYKQALYKEMSTLVAQNIHADIPIGYYIGEVYSVKRNLKTFYIRCAEIVLEKEIYEVVRMIKEHYEKSRSNANLILAIVSLDGLDGSDYEEIEDLRKKIKQEL